MIKLMEITDTWTRLDNQMSTNDFMIQVRNEVGLELTSDISATKGLELGYLETYKILVATKAPIKSPVKIRAKEMGINIIIFDGNEEKFLKTIKSIIK